MLLDGVNDLETIITDMRRKLDSGEASTYSGATYGVDWEDGQGEYQLTVTLTRPGAQDFHQLYVEAVKDEDLGV
uniref:Uncharacterized protein n=4 Tax=unclassified bacterial viruses TaxID=12333 RepID=A0AAU6W0J8_9VIRU